MKTRIFLCLVVFAGMAFSVKAGTIGSHSIRPGDIPYIKFTPSGAITISSGAITIDRKTYYEVDGEGAAADDLDTINGGTKGQRLMIIPADAANNITLKHGTGNIVIGGGADYTIPDNGAAWLIFDGTNWRVDTGAEAAGTFVSKTGDTMTGQLKIDGGSDEVQLIVEENATQTANLFELNTSGVSGGDVFVVDSTGKVGIGESSPNEVLVVSDGTTAFSMGPLGFTSYVGFAHGNVDATAANYSYGFNATDTLFNSPGATGAIVFRIGGGDQFMIDFDNHVINGDTDGLATARTGGLFRAPDVVTGGAGDVAGADLTISSGIGTGVGDVGQLIFQTGRVAAAGDNLQSRVTLLTLDENIVTIETNGGTPELRIEDASGDYTGFKTGVQAGNIDYTLPTDDGDANEFLQTNGAGVLTWAASGAGDVTKVGTPVDSQVGVWTGDGTIEGAATFTYDGSNLQLTGDIGSTGTRITKGWFTDLQVTNAIAGSVTGNAGTVTTITGLAPDTATTAAAQPNITSVGTLTSITTSGLANLAQDAVFTEQADHTSTPGAGFGYLWVKNTAPSSIIFTDDAGTDTTLSSGSGDVTKVGTPANDQLGVWTGDGTIEGDADLTFDGTDLTTTGSINLAGDNVFTERADHASTPAAGYGYLWVKNTAPSTIIFTDDAGTDTTLSSGSGDVTKVGTPVDSQVGVWTGDGTIEGAATLTYDGSNLQLTGDIGSTGTRITKGWFTDLQVTNAIAGSITGNAATVSTITGLAPDTATSAAAQPNITSLGTLTALQVDNININGNTISSTAGTDLLITPLAGQQIVLDGTIEIDAGVVTGATSISSTAFVGALTGQADTVATIAGLAPNTATTAAAQPNITSVGTLTSITTSGIANLAQDAVFTEQADHTSTPGAGFGYLWVKNTAPSSIIFTDDAGTDTTLSSGSGDVSKVGTPANDQLGVWTGDGTIEGDADLTFDGTDLTTTGSFNLAGDNVFTERADHASTPAAGYGYVWTKNTTPSTLIFTDDAGTDTTLGVGDLKADGTTALTADWDTGNFSIKTLVEITDHAATGSITAAECRGGVTTNTGSSGSITLTLPDAQVGMTIVVVLTVAQDVDIDVQAGEQILILTDATGDAISSDATIGSSVTLVAVSATQWMPIGQNGTWTDVN